jgi:uracil-DNA glycosylase
MISEAMPSDIADYFYQTGTPMFIQTTNRAFADAGFYFSTAVDYLNAGIYLTTAIKCRKKDYLVSSATLKNCSSILGNEIGQFPNVRAIILMGDFALRSVNYIWKTTHSVKVIPSGATYKIRSGIYEHAGVRFFPSYTQTGDSFDIEKSKRRMIADDIKKAMELIV